MTRSLSAVAAVIVLAAPAAAQTPKIGTPTQIEFTANKKSLEFEYPIQQGDRFRIQVEPVKGAEMGFLVTVYKDTGDGFAVHDATARQAFMGKIDHTNAKGLPGKRVKITVACNVVGKANILIAKAGEPAADDPKDVKIKKLEDENAALKKDLADLKQQLAEIRKLLEAKKP